MEKLILAGNWKMNGVRSSAFEFLKIVEKRKKVIEEQNMELVIFPPFTLLSQFSENLSCGKISIGSQNVSQYSSGAFTGEISIKMLEDLMCKYVIIGHSERRLFYKENCSLIKKKYTASINSKLQPILCVGETLQQRRSMQTFDAICNQLNPLLEILKENPENSKNVIVAYEPFWSIGTGAQPTCEEVREVAEFIRGKITDIDNKYKSKVKILYGGSINKENVKNIPTYPVINGLLIGKSSLSADQFLDIGISFSAYNSKLQ